MSLTSGPIRRPTGQSEGSEPGRPLSIPNIRTSPTRADPRGLTSPNPLDSVEQVAAGQCGIRSKRSADVVPSIAKHHICSVPSQLRTGNVRRRLRRTRISKKRWAGPVQSLFGKRAAKERLETALQPFHLGGRHCRRIPAPSPARSLGPAPTAQHRLRKGIEYYDAGEFQQAAFSNAQQGPIGGSVNQVQLMTAADWENSIRRSRPLFLRTT